ncbi:HlyD family efflux transporter periplasmic adaptor subunit [Anaerotruncus sp. X29]|jgi:HlyD family secretion protein|uniref:efflux RND transporter periplasmic adaptor subunit n=1 Tax=Anaerotruncus sp. G3(2012) TaxID=1235835 RepID=UPI00033583C8|nr:HlyD family efflux transporter periplasmic adaptor subunit [Anaerotruncus sp. G3(2012)]EOS64063.1 efflux transporter, RND family, MFP subunit [Anaerotruncus sp. G3(2012)]MCI9161440.1 HlyD family efflux transporter periplasmic adaptor subunit [Anaerotruncus sp.]MCI9236092.1 HlyD family efflux transporter periplasmic adaptor subunit [Anaerotruncus sp.]NCE74841.1 HlyD family efflux transporter periplasmic adaptor subunit [Anaerotruncus sp. X29]
MNETTDKLDYQEVVPVETQAAVTASQQQEIARFTRKKPKKKKIIMGAVVIAAVAIGGAKILLAKPPVPAVTTVGLERRELVNQVGVSGVVESAQGMQVYSTVSSTVNTVNVKVGDRVSEGDVLAQLDTTDLELDIAQQQSSIYKQAQLGQLELEAAQRERDYLDSDLQEDMDSQLVSAEHALDAAQRELNDARRDLKDNKDDIDFAEEVLLDLERKRDRAEDALKKVEKELKKAQQNGTVTPELEQRVETARDNYMKAATEYHEEDTSFDGDYSMYTKLYRQARTAYETALSNYEIAKQNAGRRLENSEDAIRRARLSADQSAAQYTLKQLQNRLEDSTIKAPIAGTVTAVYAKEGGQGSGLLFVIENTDDLVVKTKVKEFDIGSVKEGMSAVIKSDATGDEEFEGRIERISPAANKNAAGEVQSSGSVEFDTDVALLSKDSGLRVGMNVRLNIILDRKENVFAVPFEAVITDPEGKEIVYAARPNAEGKLIATAVPVTSGMETDFYLEVSGEGLQEGDLIISDAASITDGMEVQDLSSALNAAAAVK